MITGAVTSTVHVAVLVVADVLPQASVATNVLVCMRRHPSLSIVPVDDVTVGVPHASVAVAAPRAASIAAELGLHARAPLAGVPVAVITGAVTSTVHVAVLVVADVFRMHLLPQMFLSVNAGNHC